MVRSIGDDGLSEFDVEQRRGMLGHVYWLPFTDGLRFIPLNVADLPLMLRTALESPWTF